MENYMIAKAKLFTQCRHGVINADAYGSQYMLKQGVADFITYSIDNPSDLRATDISYKENGVEFVVKIDGKATGNPTDSMEFFVPIKGRFTVYNALGVIGAALIMNIPPEIIKKGLAKVKGVPGRIQDVPNDKNRHVIIDYAHSPDSLVNIINAVREFTKGRVIVLFGCGGDRDSSKRPIMGKIAGELADYCVITSDNPRGEDPISIIRMVEEGTKETSCPYKIIPERREAIFEAVKILDETDTLIVAGKGHETYQIIGDTTVHFDDLEVAREALELI
jgi:UDP-N-acetylmuramoyl-L-alanyl-D-glutamate--2,6-diaminopimelate ligase